MGVVVTGRRPGSCQALRWDGHAHRYLCGAITEPVAVLHAGRLPLPNFAVKLLARGLPKLACRWVSVGTGCDCDLNDDVNAVTPLPATTEPNAPG